MIMGGNFGESSLAIVIKKQHDSLLFFYGSGDFFFLPWS